MKAHIGQPRRNAPENRPPQLRHETKNPYLNSYSNAANETSISHVERVRQLGTPSVPAPETTPNRPQKPLFQLRHKTKNPYLSSYPNAANETKISYEKSVSSYDFGRIPICEWPHTRPGTAFPQLRHRTKNPYLNSYNHETSETGQASPVPMILAYGILGGPKLDTGRGGPASTLSHFELGNEEAP